MQDSLEYEIQKIAKFCPDILREDINPDDRSDYTKDGLHKKMWLNPMQLLSHNFNAREQYILCGRGGGKTQLSSLRVNDCMASIPCGSGVYMCASLKMGFTKTLPNLMKAMRQQLGKEEGRDIIRGRINPKWGWDMPIAIPNTWENVVAMPNGCIMYVTSTMVASASNGRNLCFAISDEARFMNWKVYVESVRPALRGDFHPRDLPGWSKEFNPFYLSEFFVSDAGIIKKEQLWEDEENSQTEEINELIIAKLAKLRFLEAKDKENAERGHPTNYAWQLAHSKKFQQELQYLRCQSKVFMRFSSIHNLTFLGKDYIARRKRDMPDLLYRAQILGQRITRDQSTAFYPNFSLDLHTYRPNESDEMNAIHNKYTVKHHTIMDIGGMTKKFDYEAADLEELSTLSESCLLDVDRDPKSPLYIAHDFNNNVNCVVTGQTGKQKGVQVVRILKSMYTCNPRMLEDLMEDWCAYFAPHKVTCPDVIVYYDHNAKQGERGKSSYASRAYLTEDYTFYRIIERILLKHGWKPKMIYTGKAPEHHIKFEFMNKFFSGGEKYFPLINIPNNEYLIAALETARTTQIMGKLHKYKGAEKKKGGDGLSDDEVLGTNNYSDMTDALDELAWGLCKYGTFGTTQWGRGRITTKSSGAIIL